MAGRAEAGELSAHDVQHLREEFNTMAATGGLNPTLQAARARFAASQTAPAPAAVAAPALATATASTGAV
jgi:hypothetical protein